MSPSMLGGLVAIGAVIVVALLLRGRGSADPMGTPPTRAPEPPPLPEPEETDASAESDAQDDDDHVVAVTSDGSALVPHGHVVRLLPPPDPGEEWKEGAGIKSATLRAERAFGMTWSAGDLRGAQIVRGGEGEGAWVLEALGRDGDLLPLDFETRDAAEAAHRLFTDHGIIELGEDEDGRPAPPSREQFAEARRRYNETIAELGTDGGEEPR